MRSSLVSAFLVSLVAAASLALAVPTSQGGPQQEGQEPATSGEEETEVPLVIPEEERARKNPIPASLESVALGGRLFSSQCVMCHGKEGNGKGDLAEEMELRVPDFTDPALQKKRTDGELFYILSEGHGDMPKQGERMRAEQRWHMINYIRTLASTEEEEEAEPPGKR